MRLPLTYTGLPHGTPRPLPTMETAIDDAIEELRLQKEIEKFPFGPNIPVAGRAIMLASANGGVAEMLDLFGQEEEEERLRRGAASSLPIATSSNLPVEDLERETTRGESMRGNRGLGAAAPGFFARLQAGDPKTMRGVAAMLFALSDAADRLTLRGQERGGGGRAMKFLQGEEELDLAKAREARAQAGEERAQSAEARAAELFPLQKRAAQTQVTAAQLKNLDLSIGAFDKLARATASGTPEEKQAALNQALRIREDLGLDIPETAVRTLMNRPDFLSTLNKYRPYLGELSPLTMHQARRLNWDDPKEVTGFFKALEATIKKPVQDAALVTASKAIEQLKASGKKGPFKFSDIELAFVNRPLEAEAVESDAVAGRLAPDYVPGKTVLGAQKVGLETRVKKEVEQEIELDPDVVERDAAKAMKIAIAQAKGAEEGREQATGQSAAFRALEKDHQTYLLRRGITRPTPKQIAEADIFVQARGDEKVMAGTIKGLALTELNKRKGGKPFKHDPRFENISDADLRALAIMNISDLAAILGAMGLAK